MEHNFIENELVILTKQTLDIFLKQKNPSELISLYTFYYYTAKWQKTNQPKCTTEYVSKGLNWNRHKVIRVKKQLLEFGLIENVRIVDEKTKKVTGYYIKMNYVFKKETTEKIQCAQNPHTGFEAQNSSVSKSDTVENEHTNALSAVNENALSTVSKKERKKKEQPKQIHTDKKENKKNNTCRKTYDQIIEEYTDNEVLRNELKENLKTRKMKKALPTNHGLLSDLKDLDSISLSTLEKIEIVKKSNERGWTSFYPLNEYDSNHRLSFDKLKEYDC